MVTIRRGFSSFSADDLDAVRERYEGFDQDEKGIVRGFMEGGDGAWLTDPAGNIVGLADGETMRRMVDG